MGNMRVVNDRNIKAAAETTMPDALRQNWKSEIFNNLCKLCDI